MVRISGRLWVRRLVLGVASTLAITILVVVGLWWRLSQGPIEVDMVTPWLKAAIQQNFGGKRTITVGGTQLERDENGHTSLRLRDIVVRDADGTVVASAPKAEVGLSAISLLTGHLRAESLNLVGAKMSVRIESNGRVTVFAGADTHPIASASPAPARPSGNAAAGSAMPKGPLRAGFKDFAGVMAWLDGVSTTGLDGHDLRELGLKNGDLIVDDRRNGKRWIFDHISASLRRPAEGGVVFRLESDNRARPWALSAAMRPRGDGMRAIGIEARRVSVRDILLALRVNEQRFDSDVPLSASIRADIAANGKPLLVEGQVVSGAGNVVAHLGSDVVRVPVEHADIRFNWSAGRRALIVPLQIQCGGDQFTLRAVLTAPADHSGVWQFRVMRGDSVIDPVILASAVHQSDEAGFALNRINVHGRIDTLHHRIDLDEGDLSRVDTRPLHNVAVAITGSLDFSKSKPHLAFGVAGTRMPMSVLKRLWPVLVAVDVRTWVESHIFGGTVERLVIAGNAPLLAFTSGGPPLADDGLSIDAETSGTTVHPVASLPAIHDADLTVHITGDTATVNLGRGTVEVATRRKLSITSGLFEVADTHAKPSPAQVHFRIDGSVPAALAFLARKSMRDKVGLPLGGVPSRGTVAAKVTVELPIGHNVPKGSARYTVAADLSSFAADKILLGDKLEASSLHVAATNDGYKVAGKVRINGIPAALKLDKKNQDSGAALQLQASLNQAARRRLGIHFGDTVSGAIPVKITGQIGDAGKDDPLNLEADLTTVKIENLLPGWLKPAGQPAHATALLVKTAKSTQFSDLAVTGPGMAVKGSLEVDNSGKVVSANFPVFALSAGDKASLKAERNGNGVLRVTMRGELYDGRSFVKAAIARQMPEQTPRKLPDLDLDIKLGTVAGDDGETLRGLNLTLSRRDGRIRSFSMKAKIGRDTPLIGDLRLRARDKHEVIYIETNDAGALFRFTNMYSRMYGGRMWIAMDPPDESGTPQRGYLSVSNFVVRGEPVFDRIVAGARDQAGGAVAFSQLHCDFTRYPGRMVVRDGVVRGPLIGVTIEGQINYVKNDVRLRGTFVPFYGLNNVFGRIPIVGLVLGGGSNEGLVGINYEAVGPPSAPQITVNPVSAIAPGLLRKFIPGAGALDPNFMPPSR